MGSPKSTDKTDTDKDGRISVVSETPSAVSVEEVREVKKNNMRASMAKRTKTLSVVIADKAEKMSKMASFVDLAMDDDDLKEDGSLRAGSVVAIDGREGESGTDLLQRAVSDQNQTGAVHVAETVGHVAGMDSNTLKRVALEDEWQMVSCASLPFTIIFFLIFMFFFQQHYGITDIFLAEAPVRQLIGTPAINLEDPFEIYDWLHKSYLPYLWGAKPENFIENRLNTPSLFQEVIGGVRFTISEAKVEPCETYEDMDCHSSFVDVFGAGHFERRLTLTDLPSPMQPPQVSPERVSTGGQHAASSEGPPIGERPVSARWAAWREKKRNRAGRRSSSTAFKRRLADKSYQPPTRVHGVFAEALSKQAPSRARSRRRSPEPEARKLRYTRPEIKVESPSADAGNRSEVVFPISMSLKDAMAELDRWRNKTIFNRKTRAFRTEVLLLNQNLGQDRVLMSQLLVEFGFHRGGLVFADVQIITLVLTALATDAVQAFLAILWVFGLIVFSGMLFSRAYVRYLQGRLAGHLKRFWNAVEWIIVGWGWLTLISFSIERAYVWGLKDKIDEHQKGRGSLPPWERTKFDMAAVPEILESANSACQVSMWVQLVVALFHIAIAFRFFLASRGQPRLAIVLNTIRKATSDLMHLLIVFTIIFLGYAVSGHLLFGRRMHEFATFSGSFARCFQIVMERQYPWARFTSEDQWTATLWVWSFLVLIVLVLVNIFLAMLFDTYGEVRASGGNTATLWQTTKIVLEHSRRLCRCKSARYGTAWVANREIIQAVKTMQSDVVTPWMVMDCFPGISVRQVNYLFNLAKNRFETSLLQSSKSSLPAVIASMLLGVERMYDKLQDLLLLTDNDEESEGTSGTSRKEVSELANFGEDREGKSPKLIEGKSPTHRKKTFKGMKTIPVPDDKPPSWQKIQLMPHIKKQQALLSQIQSQIKRIRQTQHLSGYSDEGLPPAPIEAPMLLQSVGARPYNGEDHPLRHTSADLHVVPAAARSGMTQPSHEHPGLKVFSNGEREIPAWRSSG
mmetsp:Transcript_19859/g.34513  ORF Transcript_19859/g.34513 Transcript_19859/m.34513 type:complete len:1023 (-) Transcript_19859:45-3113(-)